VSPQQRTGEFEPLRRGLGSPVLFGLVQAFLAAALYFSLGLAVERTGGWTWIVYAAAAGFFVVTMLSYVEGASLHQERGGATVIARYAFNELWSFVAGWAILLDYIILVALTGFVATDYLGVFAPPLDSGTPEFLLALVLILIVAAINVRGLDPVRFSRVAIIGIADLAVQVLIVGFGIAFLLEPDLLTAPSTVGGSPGLDDLAFSFTLAIVAFTGLDASSGFAGQVAVSRRGLRRLVLARGLAVLIPYVGITIVASSTLGAAGVLSDEDRDSPLVGLAGAFEQEWLSGVLTYMVGLSAAAVLFSACASAMLGLSRLGYSLALNRQIPSTIGRLHPTYRTPVVVIGAATVLAIGLMAPVDIEFLGGLYAFGATIAFTLVHLSVIRLRFREPDRDRPFKMPLNVRMAGAELPIPAVVGAVVSIAALVAVFWLHPAARIIGTLWMALGVALYVYYRSSEGKTIGRRVTVPEQTLSRSQPADTEYGTILVPVLGTPLDDDIMQTAGRLAAESRPDEEEEGALIEAVWVFEIPLALPIDSRLPEADLKRARAALAHAKAVGEEYAGVTVSPFTVRSRRAGQAIVREAKRRGVEAIVMPAEEPSRIRGGMLLGGKEGLRDTFVGETTRYVVNKAHCRVILTAPASEERLARRAAEAERHGAPPTSGDPTRPVRRAAERLRQAGAAARAGRKTDGAARGPDPRD
jgi:APA family basic amino acid/polyamine antiporter